MDKLVRGTAADAQIRIFAAYSKDLVEEARSRHNTSPVATAALGRLLTAGTLMGAMLKGDKDLITISVNADGPIEGITVTADSHGTVKGYVGNPMVNIPANSIGKLDVAGAVGQGFLQVIKDMGLKEPYVGGTKLISGELAEDLTYYFADSEQVPSSVGLGVLMNKNNTVKHAGGFIVQLMPFADEEVISRLESNLSKIKSVTSLFDEGLSPEGIIDVICEGLNSEITELTDISFHCNCSKERVSKALLSIGEKELNEMIEEGKEVELSCSFCNSFYRFSVDELKAIAAEAKK